MNDLLQRMRSHILQMAPHQRQLEAGRLIIEAEDRIEALEREREPESGVLKCWNCTTVQGPSSLVDGKCCFCGTGDQLRLDSEAANTLARYSGDNPFRELI